jgi:Ca2+-binding RTX toxin-like protein
MLLVVAVLAITPYHSPPIKGTEGNDVIRGSPTADKLRGFGENDTIVMKSGSDKAHGGPGNNTIISGRNRSFDTINCGAGFDTIRNVQVMDINGGSCERVTSAGADR